MGGEHDADLRTPDGALAREQQVPVHKQARVVACAGHGAYSARSEGGRSPVTATPRRTPNPAPERAGVEVSEEQSMAKVIFADYIVQEGEIQHNGFECAAWDEEIALTPGEYPISAELDAQGEVKDSVHFSVPGTIKSDWFQSLSCGMPIGRAYDPKQNTGKSKNWRGHFYAHAVASRILDGTETHIRLRPGFEARRVDFDWCGEAHHTYAITRVEDDRSVLTAGSMAQKIA
jgi:hypothetical protein